MTLSVSETRNMDLVTSILWTPTIWENIAPDGVERFPVPYDDDCTYYLVNETDGVIIFHPFRDGLKIHPNIVPEKRGKVAYRAIEKAIRAVFEAGYDSVYAEVDNHLMHVIWCAKALGFKTLQKGNRELMVRRNLDG